MDVPHEQYQKFVQYDVSNSDRPNNRYVANERIVGDPRELSFCVQALVGALPPSPPRDEGFEEAAMQ